MIEPGTRIIDLTVGELVNLLDQRYGRDTSMSLLAQPVESENMKVKECAELTGYSEDYIRQLVFKKEIPYYKGKKLLRFKRSEILAWMYRKKVNPIQEAADNHINSNSLTFRLRKQ